MTLPFYILLFLSGLGMLFVSGLPWTTPWVLSGIVGFVLMAFLGARVYGPAQRQMQELADQPDSPTYKALEERSTRILVIVLLLAVLVEYIMTVKPSLWG
jgi:cell division protein FtsW (lipid II flippase)